MTEKQIQSILEELNNILQTLDAKGIVPTQQEHKVAASLLKEDLRENRIQPTKTFAQKMLQTAKDLFPLVVPLIKALL